MAGQLTPSDWIDVSATTYDTLESSFATYGDLEAAFTNYYEILEPVAASGPSVSITEGVSIDLGEVFETVTVEESHIGFIDSFTVVFNESLVRPGFIVTLTGVQGLTFSVFRRDPTGNIPDRRVRGLAEITATDDNLQVTDYEAPLGVVLHYYFRISGTNSIIGPVIPTPIPYIPTLKGAYGQGVVFAKLIDIPEASIPLLVETWDEWERPARVHAEHDVLGREFPVVITDVAGSRRGSISGHAILAQGMHISRVESLIKPGTTILLQNNNPRLSGLPDMYVKVTQSVFVRDTKMVSWGEQDGVADPRQVAWTFKLGYVEVARPDPTNVVIDQGTWGTLLDINPDGVWGDLLNVYNEEGVWLDLLKGEVS